MPAPKDPDWQKHFERWKPRYNFTPEELDSAWDTAWEIYKKEKDARDSASPAQMWATADKMPAPDEKPYNAQSEIDKIEGSARALVIQLVSVFRFGGGIPPSIDL